MSEEKKPHVHAELIKAWADGAKIQFFGALSGEWLDCLGDPEWSPNRQYRIKPEKRKAWLVLFHKGGVAGTNNKEILEWWERHKNFKKVLAEVEYED